MSAPGTPIIPDPNIQPPVIPPTINQPTYIDDFTHMLEAMNNQHIRLKNTFANFLETQCAAAVAPPSIVPPVTRPLGGHVRLQEPHMFGGKMDEVTPFINDLRHIQEFNPQDFSTDHKKVLYTGMYLKAGIPLEWFTHLESTRSPLLHDWEAFVTAFKLKFSDPRLSLTSDQKLDRLQQTGSAHSYLTRFLELSSHLDMTEQTKINRFMKVLKPAIKDHLVGIVDHPATLAKWKNIIIQIDANLHQ